MLYTGITLKGINMITRAQDSDLKRSFVCRSGTSAESVRHVS